MGLCGRKTEKHNQRQRKKHLASFKKRDFFQVKTPQIFVGNITFVLINLLIGQLKKYFSAHPQSIKQISLIFRDQDYRLWF